MASAQTSPLDTKRVMDLFKTIEARFPSDSLGTERWYLVTLVALTGAGETALAADLYQYLITKPQYTASDARKALMRRLREALVKSVSVMGVCKPLEAVFALIPVTAQEDKDYSFNKEHWKSGSENIAQGQEFFKKIYYEQNKGQTTDKFAEHKDFGLITSEITYGFYLGDLSILDEIDTEMVVLSGIAIQNLPLETAWHLRGTRRIGVSASDVETIQQCIERIAHFTGTKVNRLPRVNDIEHEVAIEEAKS